MTNEQACVRDEYIVQAKREKSYCVWCKVIGWHGDAAIATGKRKRLMQMARSIR
jgi:hypothetical protein